MTGAPISFAAVALELDERGWRPFPGLQESKVPAMKGWPELNKSSWDRGDLAAAAFDYQPAENYCCCLAAQSEIVALDIDITDTKHADFAAGLADDMLGETPMVRIGFAPKTIRIYRSSGGIRSRKLHPLEIFCGSGQFVGYGWHQRAGRPYDWPKASPLDLATDSIEIPAVTPTQLERFTAELFKVVPRRQSPMSHGRHGGPMTIGDRLRMLTTLHGSWTRAAAIVLGDAVEGNRNETAWTVVASAAGRGVSEEVVWRLFEHHFTGWDGFSESELASAIERAQPRQEELATTFWKASNFGGGNVTKR